jgi:hypothetical protein
MEFMLKCFLKLCSFHALAMRYTVVTVVVTLLGIEQRLRISLDTNNTQMPVPVKIFLSHISTTMDIYI